MFLEITVSSIINKIEMGNYIPLAYYQLSFLFYCLKELSVFVQRNSTPSAFNTSDSWVILNPIEQNIKRKIEAIGTPLKDWDIKIYRGVLTGYNEAFIINSEKRTEILANCKDAEERKRTDELIRPYDVWRLEKTIP